VLLSGSVAALACLSLVAVGPGSAPAGAAPTKVPVPKVQGPVEPSSGLYLIGSTLFSPSKVGYEQSEYFLSGTARSYTSTTPLAENGRWHVVPKTSATYKTRVVVYRPINPKRFDGTVVVEWFNVTAGVDAAAAWLTSHIQMIRSGMAYVGVDAQGGGIGGERGSIGTAYGSGGLEQVDPGRYQSLHHPGDSYSFSIFEQAGEAVHAAGSKLLGGLQPKRVLALGESQSAGYMVTYIDAIQPLSPGVFNAYFVYSRGGNGADLSQSPQPTLATPYPTFIRTDLHVPVFLFETEADLLGLGYLPARQPPTKYIREWEVAGTAHDDTYGLLYSRSDSGSGSADVDAFDSMLNPPSHPIPGIIDCAAPVNAGSHTYEARAAMVAVNNWVARGNAPQESPRLDVDASGHAFVADANGNALGGVRTPQVVAPVAKLSGIGQPGAFDVEGTNVPAGQSVPGAAFCGIFGTTVPFSASQLAILYPTHAAFVSRWDDATAAAVKAGYLLPADARILDKVAAQSNVGG
jgi:hypothetical protein